MTQDEWKSYIMSEVTEVKKLISETVKNMNDTNILLQSFVSQQKEINFFINEKFQILADRVTHIETTQEKCPAKKSGHVWSRVFFIVGSIFSIIGVVLAIAAAAIKFF